MCTEIRSCQRQYVVHAVTIAAMAFASVCFLAACFETEPEVPPDDAPVCGNSVREADEECDGTDFGDRPPGYCESKNPEIEDGELICTADCKIDPKCLYEPICGDGYVDSPHEICEPGNVHPGFGSCLDYGYLFGELECGIGCDTINASKCWGGCMPQITGAIVCRWEPPED